MGTVRVPNSGDTFGQQSWAGGWTHSRADVPHADPLVSREVSEVVISHIGLNQCKHRRHAARD